MWIIAKYIKYIAIFAILWVALVTYSRVSCHKIYHDQMQPTIQQEKFKPVWDGERAMDKVERDDIVIFEYQLTGSQESPYFCGRVIGKEGDRVEIAAGRVKLNGQEKTEAYVPADSLLGTEYLVEVIVPRGHYFILGDNRRNSQLKDSRAFGPIPVEAVVGKVSDLW